MKLTGKVMLFALMLNLALIAGGCGGKKSESPTSVVNRYHQAIMDKDIDTVMSLSAPGTDKARMQALLDLRSEGIKRGGLPKVLKEKINGDTAVVTCQFGPVEQDVNLIKVNGKWKVK